MMIVAKDGSGDFTRIQDAVDTVPEGKDGPVRILVRAGEYREKVVIHRDGIRLAGEDRDRTVIVWNGCAKDLYADGTEKGTFLSSTLMTTGRDITVENVTIRNDAGDGREVGQAVTLRFSGKQDCETYLYIRGLRFRPDDENSGLDKILLPVTGYAGEEEMTSKQIGFTTPEDPWTTGRTDFLVNMRIQSRPLDRIDLTLPAAVESAGSISLDSYYIRTDSNGKSYCYVMGDDGLLEKRYIKTGSNAYGTVEIRSGLKEEDYIAFPYGDHVKEGAETVIVSSLSALGW